MPCSLILPKETCNRLAAHVTDLRNGRIRPGGRLAKVLASADLSTLTDYQLLAALLDTKEPCIFAESAVHGDGTDWTLGELALLGDVSVATDVTVYDDGSHRSPSVHPEPFPATLVFTPGALLHNGTGHTPADWAETTTASGELDLVGYAQLYNRRLRPVFDYIQNHAMQLGVTALVTVPGLGCGQFAGRFRGQLGVQLERVLETFLANHAHEWTALRAVYYDPYQESVPRRVRHHGVDFLVRPLSLTPGGGHPQLCPPANYAETDADDFASSRLYSLVAWDHVSWPGNDFNAGQRATDDGVKAAATSALHAITGIAGHYDSANNAYTPPSPYSTWSEILKGRRFPDFPKFTPCRRALSTKQK